MRTKELAQKPEKNKAKHQLNLVEEKRAFVVIGLTDKLSLAGKLVAFNALAHYNSERGYSWASIPVVAKESGYSPTSTKSISPGFDEIEKVGAFKVIRNPPSKGGKKSSTHRCCPIMPWFRDEYERLRLAGKIEQDDDPFADIRSDNDNDERQGAQPDQDESQGPRPGQIGSTTRSDRAHNPVRQGYKPDEENRLKGTERNEPTEAHIAPASGERGPADGLDDAQLKTVVQGDHHSREATQARANNDNQPVDDDSRSEEQPVLSYSPKFDEFWNAYPRKLEKDKPAAYSQWLEIKQAGGVTSDQIMRGLSFYKRAKRDGDPNHVMYPVRWLKERLWTEFAAMPSGSKRMAMAI